MKKFLITVLFNVSFLVATYAQKEIVVDPNASVRTIGTAFRSIKVTGNIKLVLSQSEEISLAVSASGEKYKLQIKTVVEDNTLKIFPEGDNWSTAKNRQLTVYLSFKTIEKLDVSGAVQVLAAGTIILKTLSINVSGASTVRAKMHVENLVMQLSGASKTWLTGRANTVSLECSGASDISAYGLLIDTCSATASGASDMQIHVERTLNAMASGASRIYYKGEPATNITSSGVSKIQQRF